MPGYIVLECCCDHMVNDITKFSNGDPYNCPDHGEEKVLYIRRADN